MSLGMEIGLGPGDLDGDPAPPRRAQPPHPIFGPCLLCPNGWMEQDATCYRSRPRPRPHCVRRGPSCPRKRGTAAPSLFSAIVYCGHGRASQLTAELMLWSLYGIGQTIIVLSCAFFFFLLFFLLSYFFPRLISAVADWMSALLPHMVWP